MALSVVSYTMRPAAGEAIALRCVVVIRGGRKPCVVEVTATNALAGALNPPAPNDVCPLVAIEKFVPYKIAPTNTLATDVKLLPVIVLVDRTVPLTSSLKPASVVVLMSTLPVVGMRIRSEPFE